MKLPKISTYKLVWYKWRILETKVLDKTLTLNFYKGKIIPTLFQEPILHLGFISQK